MQLRVLIYERAQTLGLQVFFRLYFYGYYVAVSLDEKVNLAT